MSQQLIMSPKINELHILFQEQFMNRGTKKVNLDVFLSLMVFLMGWNKVPYEIVCLGFMAYQTL